MEQKIMYRKKYITAVLSLAMCTMLSACAGNTKPIEADKEPEKEAVVEVSDESLEEETSQVTEEVENVADAQTEQDVAATDDTQDVIDEDNENSSEDNQEEEPADTQADWVANLDFADDASQIIVVAASGNYANVTFHQREDDTWTQLMETEARIGENGIGKTKEGDRKTPQGILHFTMAFGKNSDPGSSFPYTQVNERCFWVDDSNSAYYNQFVTTDIVSQDWNSAEKLLLSTDSYNYVLATDYNSDCVPGVGSALFMHCLPTGGAGCIAIPEADMKYLVQNVTEDCVLYIDYEENIER